MSVTIKKNTQVSAATAVDVPASISVVEVPTSIPVKTARKKLVVEISADTHKNLRKYALDEDKTLTELVDEMLTAGVRDAGYK